MLESLLPGFRVWESRSCECPFVGDTAACLSRHRRRRAAGSTSPFGRRARAGKVPRTSNPQLPWPSNLGPRSLHSVSGPGDLDLPVVPLLGWHGHANT